MSSTDNRACDSRAGHTVEKLLSDFEVAKIVGMSVAWVRRLRQRNDGPPYRKLGGRVRYDPAELKAWLASRPLGRKVGPEDKS